MDLQKYFADLGDALCAGGMTPGQSAAYCKRLSDGQGGRVRDPRRRSGEKNRGKLHQRSGLSHRTCARNDDNDKGELQ